MPLPKFKLFKTAYVNSSCCYAHIANFILRSSTVSSILSGAFKAARLEAGHVPVPQLCCQSSCPIKLGMTFKVGRGRRTECPYLLCTSPAVEPVCSILGWVCLCVVTLARQSGIKTAVTSPTCHMQHRGDARGQGIRRRKDGHKEECLCMYALPRAHVSEKVRMMEDVGW